MLSKQKRAYEPEQLPPDKRLKANIKDIFATNQLSGVRSQELINDIADSGVMGFRSLKKSLKANVARNLRRSFLKGCLWPSVYWGKIRVKSLKTNKEDYEWAAFLLPHELIECIAKYGVADVVMDTKGLDTKTMEHLRRCQDRAKCSLLPKASGAMECHVLRIGVNVLRRSP